LDFVTRLQDGLFNANSIQIGAIERTKVSQYQAAKLVANQFCMSTRHCDIVEEQISRTRSTNEQNPTPHFK
jgi:hypothetical protein